MDYREGLHIWRKWIAGSPLLVKLTTKIRNQANKIIAYSLATSHDPAENGEELLISQIAGELQTIVDVGANKGEWTLMVRRYAPANARFYLVEPGMEASKMLQSLTSSQLNTYQIGLSDTVGELDFYEEAYAGEQSSFIVNRYHSQYTSQKVTVQTLDLFCRENNIQQIDLLKIDCEGYDYKVLLGAINMLQQTRIKYLQFEYGNSWKMAGSTLKAAVSYLNQLGYKVWAVSPIGLVDFDVDFFGDYFEYSNFFAAKSLPKQLCFKPNESTFSPCQHS